VQKKGVSPLIATVLLLAFTVSLITVVIQLNPFSDVCSELDLKIKENICFNNNAKEIQMKLINYGAPISTIEVQIDTELEEIIHNDVVNMDNEAEKNINYTIWS